MKDDPKPSTIELTDAIRYARTWRKEEGSYYQHNELHAFWIPKDDFLGMLTEEIDAVRGYLGVGDDGKEKLMFVGTKLNPVTGVYEDMLPDLRTPGNYIYDLTIPCPNMCDNKSILNEAPPQKG